MTNNKKLLAALALTAPFMIPGLATGGARPVPPDAVTPPADVAKPIEERKDVNRSIRLSETLRSDIYNRQDVKLGMIEDLVLDGGLNRISYAVLSYGGFMGVADKQFAVPWTAFDHTTAGPKRVILDFQQDQLKTAPGFDKKNWPDIASPMFRTEVDRFYNRNLPVAARDPEEVPGKVVKGLTWCRRITAVIGANVVNSAGEKLGDINDLVAANQTGELQYAVLGSGGVLGLGEKFYVVPISQITTKADAKEFVLSITKDQLKNAPSFDKNSWPDWTDPQYRRNVENYFTDLPVR